MLSDWAVYVRNAAYERVAQIDEVISLECSEHHLGVGAWVLELPFRGAAVDALLTTPGAGIEVRHRGRVVFAGPMRLYRRERTVEHDRLTVRGVDDVFALACRVVHPQPLTAAPPFSTAAYDSHTGPASTVLWQFIDRNAGPGALLERRWPGLTMAADPAEGVSIGVSGRWAKTLLDLVHDVGGPHLMSVLVRPGGGGLVCTVRACRDRTNVELSPRAGTLQGWVMEASAPEMTAGWAGGQGELTARTVVQDAVAPPGAWPLRLERFVDYRNAETTAELQRVLTDALVEGAAQTSLEITPSEGIAARFGLDFDLGDRVTVVLDQVRTVETVTTSTVRFDGASVVRTFNVGPESRRGLAAVFSRINRLGSRVRNLEGI